MHCFEESYWNCLCCNLAQSIETLHIYVNCIATWACWCECTPNKERGTCFLAFYFLSFVFLVVFDRSKPNCKKVMSLPRVRRRKETRKEKAQVLFFYKGYRLKVLLCDYTTTVQTIVNLELRGKEKYLTKLVKKKGQQNSSVPLTFCDGVPSSLISLWLLILCPRIIELVRGECPWIIR